MSEQWSKKSANIKIDGNFVPYGFKGVIEAIKLLFKRNKTTSLEFSFHSKGISDICDVNLIEKEPLQLDSN